MIYVTGADGQLGNEIARQLGNKAEYLNRSKLDLENNEEVRNFLASTKIDLLINTAAYTKVDLAETNQKQAELLNCELPALFAETAKNKNFKLIHFSTDYVFNGKKSTPYNESDATDPLNFYGKSKLMGEEAVMSANPDALILRTSWVYSKFGKNFIKTILTKGMQEQELRVVFDQIGTLTYASDLAQTALAARDLSGIFHYSNEGVSSWYDVAHVLKKSRNLSAKIKPILSKEFQTPVSRPQYSVLDKSKIKSALNLTIPHWMESLEICLKEIS